MEIINRVAQSAIEVYNLESLWDGKPVVAFDLAKYLHKGLVLREMPFREAMTTTHWATYDDVHVAITCSTPAIVPRWAYMLVVSFLEGHAVSVAFGNESDLVRDHFVRALSQEDWSRYSGVPVVLKGCNSPIVPLDAYLLATRYLQRYAKRIMYGEPCSAVPIWRKPKALVSVLS
ncbi:MAG TPA: DUF2480 family protein [Rhodothermales bacterium]|nr:hypothetical protein [Bacteroidota bacterium]HRK74605.1 DUF2480 family protein [Rhodothermales bacterium]HRR08163.1 DUF2480 family protein [Rhodothermales bacterium]